MGRASSYFTPTGLKNSSWAPRIARYIFEKEDDPVDPAIKAAREYYNQTLSGSPWAKERVLEGNRDHGLLIQAFLAGAKWARENK
jgi:hypothetical protein